MVLKWLIPVVIIICTGCNAWCDSQLKGVKCSYFAWHIPKWIHFFIPLGFMTIIWIYVMTLTWSTLMWLVLLCAMCWSVWKIIYLKNK